MITSLGKNLYKLSSTGTGNGILPNVELDNKCLTKTSDIIEAKFTDSWQWAAVRSSGSSVQSYVQNCTVQGPEPLQEEQTMAASTQVSPRARACAFQNWTKKECLSDGHGVYRQRMTEGLMQLLIHHETGFAGHAPACQVSYRSIFILVCY